METDTRILSGINDLVDAIQKTNEFFFFKAQQQVNSSLTLRNWVIGWYIVEYEHNGKDRADYGENLYSKIAGNLKAVNGESLRERHLYICKRFYLTYPQILRSPTANSY